MNLLIKNDEYAFLIRVDLMFSMSLCHYITMSIVTNFKRPICQTFN